MGDLKRANDSRQVQRKEKRGKERRGNTVGKILKKKGRNGLDSEKHGDIE